MSHVVRNAEECAQAIESALIAMDPPLEVFDGIVRLIAELVPYGECGDSLPLQRKRASFFLIVRFDTDGGGLTNFDVSDDGATQREERPVLSLHLSVAELQSG